MPIDCPFCKTELSQEFIVEAFMQMPIEGEDEDFKPLADMNAEEEIAYNHRLARIANSLLPGIHEPQGDTITTADYPPVPDNSNQEWSPEAMAYVEKVQK